jgi:hypothetical protein
MANDLLRKVSEAGAEGNLDVKAVLRQFLVDKCRADDRVCAMAFSAWLFATLVFSFAVAMLILGDGASEVPGLSALPRVPDQHLQAIAGACGVVSSVMFMIFLKLRQEQTKHTFLLIMVTEGNVRDAAALLLGHRESKGGMVMDAADAVLGGLT